MWLYRSSWAAGCATVRLFLQASPAILNAIQLYLYSKKFNFDVKEVSTG
jgi:hypothetical protein